MQNSQSATQPFQITKVWAKNFRSLADVSVDLDRLTILVGPNASGKSNVLDSLRFIKDAFRFDLNEAVSLRNGFRTIRYPNAAGQLADIELGLEAHVGAPGKGYTLEYAFTLSHDPDGGVYVKRESGRSLPDSAEEPFVFRMEKGTLTYPEWLVAKDIPPHPVSRLGLPSVASRLPLHIAYKPGLGQVQFVPASKEHLAIQSVILDDFYKRMRNARFYHIFPNTLRGPQMEGNAYSLDEDAGNLASVLSAMEKEGSDWMPHLKDSLQTLLPEVSDLEVTELGRYLAVSLKHDALQADRWLDLSQESDGTIRLLGLLTALYQSQNPPLIGIEEPELTVHPGTLSGLAGNINEASQRSQVIVTTHSPDLIDCLTDYRKTDCLRIVELREGATVVGRVADTQIEAVRQNLFSPGELHRMEELELPRGDGL